MTVVLAMDKAASFGVPRGAACDAVLGAKQAAGIVFCTTDGKVLLLKRSDEEKNYGGYWGLPGGGVEAGETPEQGALREAGEEIGYSPDQAPAMKVLDRVMTPTGMVFTTFCIGVDAAFDPVLNAEHSAFEWADLAAMPTPVHPSVARCLGEHLGVAADMTPNDWGALKTNFAHWAREEAAEPSHRANPNGIGRMKQLVMKLFDEEENRAAMDAVALADVGITEPTSIAMDRDTARSYDKDGRLHVSNSHISKAAINEYFGREIPDFEKLGLQPDRRYKLFRDPEELAKAAPTFNNLPLLTRHVPITADSHPKDLVIGSTGTDAVFKAPYLDNSLVIWARDGISDVEAETKKELSCAYRYTADMTPGNWNGQRYDGRMTDITGNHVALVKSGRAGEDVVVGDAKPSPVAWSFAAFTTPRPISFSAFKS